MDVYVRQVEIIKRINIIVTQIIINLKRKHYNDNIYVCSRHLKVIHDDMVRNSSGRMFHGTVLQYFGAATVKAASAYIDETSGKESFISSHLRLG